MVSGLAAGEYWVAIQLGNDDPFYRYKPFTVYATVGEYVEASLDKMIAYYETKGLWQNDTYVGLSTWEDTGTDWMAWIFPNDGHTLADDFLSGADGKTYLDALEGILTYRETNELENSSKDYFRCVAALSAVGENPRDFNGRNLVVNLLDCAYQDDGTLKLDENGALVIEPDILAVSYLLLGAELAGATEAEGYTDALKEAGIKAILPTVETSVNAETTDVIASADFLAMMSYPLYFLQDDETYGERITTAIGQMADMVSTYQYANGGLNMSWPGADSEGSTDDPLTAEDYGTNTNSMAVMLNALVLFGTTVEDLDTAAWQEESGNFLTALIGLQMEDGSMGFHGNSNRMATYQTLGALIELVTGKSCFVNAQETYLANYPDYENNIVNPFIADGSGKRLHVSKAGITFTTNEAGHIYYAVVDSGVKAPTIDTTGTGVPCVAGENTFTIDDLTGREAKDVYVQVKDGDGNVSKILTIAVAYAEEQQVERMIDVPADSWYFEDVAFAMQRGIFKGASATMFYPGKSITRGQFITILGRTDDIADTPQGTTVSTQFNDVNGKAYYASHVAWGVGNGIVNGVSATSFAPNAKITRQDMAVMIYRYAEVMGIALPDGSGEAPYADHTAIADYAKTAVYSMKAAGIINGTNNNRFAPTDFATRAEAAAIMHRLIAYAEKD